MLYLRFMISMAVGLAGVAMVLKILMDILLIDWDIPADLKKFRAEFSKKKQLLVNPETAPQKVEQLATRLNPMFKTKSMEGQFLASPKEAVADAFGRPAEPAPQLLSLS